MCYNNSCTIKIVSSVDGVKSSLSTTGRVEETSSGKRFCYVLDGDECTLTVNKAEAVQTRSGEQNIKIIFRKGERTECELGSGGFSGTVTVYTHDIKFTIGQEDSLYIVYTLGEQKIKLNFLAQYNSKVEI